MVNFDKPLHEMTAQEIHDGIQNTWPPEFGALGVMELLRRQQAQYAKQDAVRISQLVKEISILKEITEANAATSEKASASSNRTAKYALAIALATLFVQLLFSIHQNTQCSEMTPDTESDPGLFIYSNCFRTFDFGLFGERKFKVSDFKGRSFYYGENIL